MYGCIEIFCNKKHGPPMTSANHDISEDVWGHEDRGVGSRMDVELGDGSAAAAATKTAGNFEVGERRGCDAGDWGRERGG